MEDYSDPYYLPYSVVGNNFEIQYIPKAIDDYIELSQKIYSEKDPDKKLSYCYQQLKILPFWVKDELSIGNFIPPVDDLKKNYQLLENEYSALLSASSDSTDDSYDIEQFAPGTPIKDVYSRLGEPRNIEDILCIGRDKIGHDFRNFLKIFFEV